MVYTLPGVRLPTVPSAYKLSSNGWSSHVDTRNAHLSFFVKNKSNSREEDFSGKPYESGSQSSMAAAPEKVLVPGTENDVSSSPTEKLDVPEMISDNSQACDVESSEMIRGMEIENQEQLVEHHIPIEATRGDDSASVQLLDGHVEAKLEGTSNSTYETISDESSRVRESVIPQPGVGQRIYEIDPLLSNYREHLDYRYGQYKKLREAIDKYEGGLETFSRGYEKLGFNRSETGITYREWAPGAKWATLIGDFNNWDPNADVMTRIRMDTPSGIKDSIPAWIKFSVQAPGEIPYNGIYYDPPEEEPVINTYANFRDEVLPRIKRLGYNAVQIMAIQEHSYYASFGYHVTNFFAPSSRFGTPDDLKSLIDKAHELGLVVLMDIVHSHASNNTLDGLNMFDGTDSCYFHSGARGYHWMWDSRLFNYGQWEVLRFLLSNARWWLDEYKFDGFRFDGVTSMMYTHHGLQVAFTGNYNEYFGFATDVDAVVYLMLVNDLIHGLFPEAITIGEDVSGMPTFCIPLQDGGIGFDYRLHMAVADKWIEILKQRDEDWKMGDIIHTLTNRRWLEKCVCYAESHDQALVGDKTIAFWLMDKDMYDFMAVDRPSTPLIDRGIALHKMIRLITMGLGGEGYLNFMGNEFGHPEWIDFPRCDQHLPDGRVIPGNNNSYDKCRRRFDLVEGCLIISYRSDEARNFNVNGYILLTKVEAQNFGDFVALSEERLQYQWDSLTLCESESGSEGDAEYLRYHGLQEFDRAMQHLEEKYGVCISFTEFLNSNDLFFVKCWNNVGRGETDGFAFMTSGHQYISRKAEGDKIIVFERGNLVFVFNFHWSNSYSDYRVGCLKPGKYKVVLDSDDPLFGGFSRINHEAEYFTFEGWHDDRPRSFLIYAPSRTAVVYALAEDEVEPVDAEAITTI
ncbi:hypothetical protein DH2020_026263 [Rehmannia glutinosa]|uniref:1,4-alpha-glucan branching enzyme n=1 Tax=Rehmannia glutinosa TaxID=99300 RepID=A0ABR0VZ79_REHGL